MSSAVYPGSFDPITNGHLDIIRRAVKHFDKLYIAIGTNSSKKSWLSQNSRVGLVDKSIETYLPDVANKIQVCLMQGLTVDFCKKRKISVILRGLRTVSDFDSEFVLGMNNMRLDPGVDTVFMLPRPEHHFTSSSSFREIFRHRPVSARDLVPPLVFETLQGKDND